MCSLSLSQLRGNLLEKTNYVLMCLKHGHKAAAIRLDCETPAALPMSLRRARYEEVLRVRCEPSVSRPPVTSPTSVSSGPSLASPRVSESWNSVSAVAATASASASPVCAFPRLLGHGFGPRIAHGRLSSFKGEWENASKCMLAACLRKLPRRHHSSTLC